MSMEHIQNVDGGIIDLDVNVLNYVVKLFLECIDFFHAVFMCFLCHLCTQVLLANEVAILM